MGKYQTLLFDVDDTLLDFNLAENAALTRLFEQENMTVTPAMLTRYKEINEGLWRAFERGEVTKSVLHNTRFSRFFEEYGITVDGAHFEAGFQRYLQEAHYYVEGAYDVIAELAEMYDLYIVSNGKMATQNKRLLDADLAKYFKGIFISEQTGYQKPMIEFFDYVFAHVEGLDRNKTLIIGDSLTADIKGGLQAGIHTCWFNIHDIENTSDIQPHYEIKKLHELHSIVESKEILAGV